MMDHFKGFGFWNREDDRVEMEPLWPGLAIWLIVLVAVLVFY